MLSTEFWNGATMSFLHVPSSSSKHSFLTNSGRTRWIEHMVNLSRSHTMSHADAAACICEQLNELYPRKDQDHQRHDSDVVVAIHNSDSAASSEHNESDNTDNESDSDKEPSPKRQRPEKARREEGYKILAPRFSKNNSLDEMKWKQGEMEVVSSVTTKNSKDILATMYGVCQGDLNRAAKALVRLLQQPANSLLKDEVMQMIENNMSLEKRSLEKKILNGIRNSISHHTLQPAGGRTTAAEAFVKNVCCAAVFDLALIDKEKQPCICILVED